MCVYLELKSPIIFLERTPAITLATFFKDFDQSGPQNPKFFLASRGGRSQVLNNFACGAQTQFSPRAVFLVHIFGARLYREFTKTTEAQIDLYFGWQERVLKKMVQVHYESLSIRARMGLAKITGWM